MRKKYTVTVPLSVKLECLVRDGEPIPDIKALLTKLLTHPMVQKVSIWENPTWQQHPGPWSHLEDAPFEPGDVLIHVCRRNLIWRTLLAVYQEDESSSSPKTIVYLPNAEEEEIERIVYNYLSTIYPGCMEVGFYPCPPDLADTCMNFKSS